MDKDFFVMLNTQGGGITPLVDENGDLATFESVEDAQRAGRESVLGDAFGFEVFQRGWGNEKK